MSSQGKGSSLRLTISIVSVTSSPNATVGLPNVRR